MKDPKNNQHPDWKHIEKYYKGDDDAIARLIYKHYQLLLGVSLKYTKDVQASEDIIQELAMELVALGKENNENENMEEVRTTKLQANPDNPVGGLVRRVRFRSIDAFRKKSGKKVDYKGELPETDGDASYDTLETMDIEITNNSLHDLLNEAKEMLDEDERNLLDLWLSGLKHQRMAEKLKVTQDELRVYKQKLKRKLKREILALMNLKKITS